MRAFVQRFPLLSYFALAFAISWGGVLLVVGGPAQLPGTSEQAGRLLPFAVLAMLLGPPVAGLLLTGLVHGSAGYRDLLARLARRRVGAGWYAVALLAVPALVMATIVALSQMSPVYRPGILTSDDKVSVLLVSIGYGLGAGFFEELGWTGFAVPRLRLRHGVVATGLLLGLVWGAWHFLTNYWGSGGPSGALSMGLFLPAQVFAVAALPAYRVIMVWVYHRTGSLLVAMLMHASFTASWLIAMPAGISGAPFLTWYLVLTGALLLAAVAVVRPALRRDA